MRLGALRPANAEHFGALRGEGLRGTLKLGSFLTGANVSSNLLRTKSPEVLEAEAKRVELAKLETLLAEQELSLATAQAEVRAFERRYLKVLGSHFAELDRIEAEIAEISASLHPHNAQKQNQARDARARAAESAQAAAFDGMAGDPSDFTPSNDIKKLYRQAAMRIHPDLASNPEDRPRRGQVMAAVNAAYEAGDHEQLRRILRDWESSPEAVTGEGAGVELIRLIRKIALVKGRLVALEAKLTALRGSELSRLKEKVEKAAREGRDLLREMATELQRQIADARTQLVQLRKSTGGKG